MCVMSCAKPKFHLHKKFHTDAKAFNLIKFNKDACFGNHSTISTFLMLLHNNGIILMVLWVAGAFIVPPCPIIIIYYDKGKIGEKM